MRSKRGRGAGGKTIVFGLFKRGGQVYTDIVPDCSQKTLQAIIRGKIDVAALVNTDGWRGYDGLVDVGFDRHFRVRYGRTNSWAVLRTSMASSPAGALPKPASSSSRACPGTPFCCI